VSANVAEAKIAAISRKTMPQRPNALRLALGLLLALLAACSPSPDAYWEGDWQVVSFELESDELDPALVAGVTEETRSSTFTFRPEGRFELAIASNGDRSEGRWTFHPDTRELLIEHHYAESPTQERYSVEEQGPDRAVLRQDWGHLGHALLVLARKP
jgi:hypothetical protein